MHAGIASINQVAPYVNDLEAAKDFFVTYLGATANDEYHNPTTGFRSYFLSFGEGTHDGAAHDGTTPRRYATCAGFGLNLPRTYQQVASNK